MIEETTQVNSNKTVPNLETMPQCMLEAFRTGFVDTGVIIKFKIPYVANTFRQAPIDDRFQIAETPSTNRMPIFGVLVDPFFSQDISGPTTPFVYPDPEWAANNLDISIQPYGHEHPLTRMAPTFAGWRGTLDYLFTVNTTVIVQGELAFIRGKYIGNGAFKWKYPQLEYDEVDNNQIINLSTEKRVMKSVSFTENTEFVNSMQYWQTLTGVPFPNKKPMNFPRNYIFVRPNTDITTLSPDGGTITVKIFMQPGPDFEFLYPTFPLRLDLARDISTVNRVFPFVTKGQLIVARRPINIQAGVIQTLVIDDTFVSQSYTITDATQYVNTPLPVGKWWVDLSKYITELPPRWSPITGIRFGYANADLNSFVVSVNVENTDVVILTTQPFNLKLGQVLLEAGLNYGPYNAIQPPFYLP
nr:MAG: hypothetical protein [Wufeng shrew polycipivirus 3]